MHSNSFYVNHCNTRYYYCEWYCKFLSNTCPIPVWFVLFSLYLHSPSICCKHYQNCLLQDLNGIQILIHYSFFHIFYQILIDVYLLVLLFLCIFGLWFYLYLMPKPNPRKLFLRFNTEKQNYLQKENFVFKIQYWKTKPPPKSCSN